MHLSTFPPTVASRFFDRPVDEKTQLAVKQDRPTRSADDVPGQLKYSKSFFHSNLVCVQYGNLITAQRLGVARTD